MGWMEEFGCGGGRRTVWCVDGYMPSRAYLEKIGAAQNPDFAHLLQRYSRGELFAQVLDKAQSEYRHRSREHCGQCDVFVLTPGNQKPVPPVLAQIYQEFLADSSREDYSIVILIPEAPKGGRRCGSCLEYGLDKVGFTVKRNYQNRESFEKDCLHLLEQAVHPYLTPCSIAEDTLKKAGFSCGRA